LYTILYLSTTVAHGKFRDVFNYSPFLDVKCRDLARILRPLVTFAEQIFFGLIMNKQEYNELNLIISYVALLVSIGD
jgi:hypothetical protein